MILIGKVLQIEAWVLHMSIFVKDPGIKKVFIHNNIVAI